MVNEILVPFPENQSPTNIYGAPVKAFVHGCIVHPLRTLGGDGFLYKSAGLCPTSRNNLEMLYFSTID